MAIPFTIPNQEVSQPNIQELLRELCEILQQLLIICRQHPTSNTNQQTTRNRVSTSPAIASQDRIPELMTNLSLLSAAFNTRNELTPTRNLRQRARRYRTTSESSCCEDAKNTSSAITTATTTSVDADTSNQQWIEVGMELRKIADDFKSSDYKGDESKEETESSPKSSSKTSSTKRDSIFSKFVPAPFTGSICTAVICVVGWHLLRNR